MAWDKTKFDYINIIIALLSMIDIIWSVFFMKQHVADYLGYGFVRINKVYIYDKVFFTGFILCSVVTFFICKPAVERNDTAFALRVMVIKYISFICHNRTAIGVMLTMSFVKKIMSSDYELNYLCWVYGLFVLNTIALQLFSCNQALLPTDKTRYMSNIKVRIFSAIMNRV